MNITINEFCILTEELLGKVMDLPLWYVPILFCSIIFIIILKSNEEEN